MESSRELEIVLHSAKSLYDVKNFGTMDPYAMVWITREGVKSDIYKTNVAKNAGSCPVWDYPILFKLVEPMINDYILFCEIQHDSKLFDRKIGELQVPLTELLAGDGPRTRVSYPVKTQSGEVKGEIIISCKFLEPVVMSDANTSISQGSGTLESEKKDETGTGDGLEETKVEEKKKDGLMKRIAMKMETKVVTGAVILAGTVGAIVANEVAGGGNGSDPKDEDDGDDDDEDKDGVEDGGDGEDEGEEY
ncbi:hypothetical protein R6Q59_035490 [Mikania micrantha]|uniref:C2 domain-containing protein n=1 Tax=Mikania micrantha TaxID=192012 RepID=A0A5N6NFX8_9ASTR|nr:hypothetical protein E3N88_23764 [Mikania micrantha]